MFRSIVVLVGGLASLSTVSLFAQDAVLGQEYGSGVHAYFAGDFLKAHERLTSAIDAGTKDPRTFYFRGLACLRLGRPQDAAIDFRKGAELESKDVNQFYNVGRALERVQGSARTELESYRVDARMAAYEAAEKLRKDRYEAIQREESRVLRAQAVAAPEIPIEVAEPAAAAGASADPFAAPEEAATPEKKTDAAPATEKPTKADVTPKKPAAVEGDDPFGEPAKPAAKTEGKKGGLLGAMGKAVGGAMGKTDKKAGVEKKAGAEKKPAEEVDPFAEPAAEKKAPVEKKADTEKKPAEEADPFAEPAK